MNKIPGNEFSGDSEFVTWQRRMFLKSAGFTAGGLILASQVDCGGKSVSSSIAIITGAVSSLKSLFPAQASTLDKIVTLANDFNSQWTAGKFDSAKTVFLNLDTTINQVISDLGINASTQVKLALAALGIGLRAVAAIIDAQGSSQPVIAARAAANAPQAVNRVKVLADAKVADELLNAVRK